MKKIICLIVILVCIILGFPKEKKIEKVKIENKMSNLLSMMLEISAGTGEYQETTASSWPTKGYTFNENLSKCENGSSLSWDNTKKIVVMSGNISDKCYVYFDKEPNTLANYIKSQYTGTQGENNLYLHDSTLENGAEDNSYRFAGSSETTNNFVCFGYDSNDGTCPTDYLYRIIGVFGDAVKLIKYDYAKSTLLGTDGDYSKSYSDTDWNGTNKGSNLTSEIGAYYWNYKATESENTWGISLLNKTNLNINYLNNIKTTWSNKIATHTWIVGGNTWNNIGLVSVSTAYKNEIISPYVDNSYNAKIGLVHVSDYGYAASQSAWKTSLNSYNSSSVINVNWMYMGLYEWEISCRQRGDYDGAFAVTSSGFVNGYSVNFSFAIRPCFYLNSNVTYKNGSGTISSPFIIE